MDCCDTQNTTDVLLGAMRGIMSARYNLAAVVHVVLKLLLFYLGIALIWLAWLVPLMVFAVGQVNENKRPGAGSVLSKPVTRIANEG